MFAINIGLMAISMATLMLELTLVRVFDVIWYPNMAYMVITLAMFCFGLSGIYFSLRPLGHGRDPRPRLALLAAAFALFAVLILPALNVLPFDFDIIYSAPIKGIVYFLLMYLALIVPFFLSGLVFTTVFSTYAGKVQRLYFWDLGGAALGCILLVPFLSPIGPGGILFLVGALGLVAAACFAPGRTLTSLALVSSLALVVTPFVHDGYFMFKSHIDKRGVKAAEDKGIIELSHWDPISKIEVIDFGRMKHIAYDGGSQSSFIFPFDGNYVRLRRDTLHNRGYNFYNANVWVSHALKRDSNQDVLVIGAAGGSETKAALTFGARHVDAVELVGYVIDIGKTIYGKYNGGIYNDPRVNAMRGEGRSFLRASGKKYDIIQMYSNHTSSSIAAGTGAMATTYLQTVEAYKEYFTHLKKDGILHINHHVYPRMVVTAARAWRELGRHDFRRHIVVVEAVKKGFQDNLPTLLVKMSPWTKAELDELMSYFPPVMQMVVDPLDPKAGMLSDEFFQGVLSPQTIAGAQYRLGPTTDNQPYFNFLRKSFASLKADPRHFLNYSTASLLNSQLKNGWIPTDVIHLIITAVASVFFCVLFIVIPMTFSRAGRERWQGKVFALIYFSCLGAAFIIIELAFIEIFMQLVGYPLYTYSTVVFSLLLAAGLGSMSSGRFRISSQNRYWIPFAGIIAAGLVTLAVYPVYFHLFLQSPILVRILAAVVLILPLGFFMGMPFPLGILSISSCPEGAIAWAWAMNGLFTVIGGIGSVLLSIYLGFRMTLLVALSLYVVALLSYFLLRRDTRA